MLHRWLNRKHLFPFYMQEPISFAEVFDKFEPRVGGNHKTKCLVACLDGNPYGYVQWYLNRSYPDYGAAVIGKDFGFSIDYFIGEMACLGKSLGSSMLRQTTKQTFVLLNASDQVAYIAHDNRNNPAIRAVLTHSESILFVDWGGDPVSSRSTGDACPSF